MTVLEDLLEQIDLDEAESDGSPKEWGDGVFEMPFSVAKALLQIAEAAFEMPEPIGYDRVLGYECLLCETQTKQIRELENFIHNDDCPWKCIQDLKMELESSQVVK